MQTRSNARELAVEVGSDYVKTGRFFDLDYTENEAQNYMTLTSNDVAMKLWLTTQTNSISIMDVDCGNCREQTLIRTNLSDEQRNTTAAGYDTMFSQELRALTFDTLQDVTFSGKQTT